MTSDPSNYHTEYSPYGSYSLFQSFHFCPQKLNRVQFCVLYPYLTGGRGADSAPWEIFLNNSKMALDIKMKFFKFNLTLMGVILHITTILINLRCCHSNLLL